MRIAISFVATFLSLPLWAQTPVHATLGQPAQSALFLRAAETSLVLSNGKTVVGYLGGLSEYVGPGKDPVPLRVPAVANCYYAGLVEHDGYLYASCTTDWGKPTARPMLLAAKITDDLKSMNFVIIAQPAGIFGSNGLAFDGKGSFYLADSGVVSGKVVQIKLNGPLKTEAPRTVHTSMKRPNGIRYDATANAIYFTEDPYLILGSAVVGTSNLNKATLAADGGFTGVKKLYSVNGYLDGFALVKGGFVLADPIKRKVFHLEEETLMTRDLVADIGATSVGFLCATCKDLLVTDTSRNAIYRVTPNQTLEPR